MLEPWLLGFCLLATPASAPASAPTANEITKITFDAAVAQAIARHPDALSAAAEIRRAAALMEQTRAGALPTIIANGTYTRLDGDRRFNGQVFVAANQLAGNVTVSVPLLVPQRWAQWSHAGDDAALARAGAGEVKRRVALAAAQAYFTVLAQHRVVALNERARDVARAHFDYTARRLGGGQGSRLDNVRAAQELHTDEARVQSAHAALWRSQAALGVLVGEARPRDADGEPDLGFHQPSSRPDAAPREAPPSESEIFARRPDLVALSARHENARRRVRDDWTDYMPSLIGVFMPMYQNPATLVQPQLAWQAQLLLSVPLYDGGLRYGQARERSAALEQADIALDAAKRQARLDLDVAAESVRRAEAALTEATEAATLAARAVEIATLAYKAGATTNLELIDAERRARDADTARVVAEDEARQARLDLLAAAGAFP